MCFVGVQSCAVFTVLDANGLFGRLMFFVEIVVMASILFVLANHVLRLTTSVWYVISL